MPNNTEKHNEKQIIQLLELQRVQQELNEIEDQRGDLPLLVNKLMTNIEEKKTKKTDSENRFKDHKKAIKDKQVEQKATKENVKTYEKQQSEAKNDQEYKLITKRLELEKVTLLLAQKKIKEYTTITEEEEIKIGELDKELTKQQKILEEKQKRLKEIDEINKVKLVSLEKSRGKIAKKLDPMFYALHEDLRKEIRQDVIVDVINDACGGCFIIIPPQRQISIINREQIIHCEHCNRILAYVQPSNEEEASPRKAASASKAWGLFTAKKSITTTSNMM